MKDYVFGIDVGGTTIKCGLFQADGTLLEKWEIPTRTENNGDQILPDVAKTTGWNRGNGRMDVWSSIDAAHRLSGRPALRISPG